MAPAAIWVGGWVLAGSFAGTCGFHFCFCTSAYRQFPVAVDICGLSFLDWEMGAGGLSHLWGCWDGQLVTEFTGEALPGLPLHVPGPAGLVGRETTPPMPTAVYPVLGPDLNTVYILHQIFLVPCKVYRLGN